ncbi:MAG: hypothetical protein VB957_12690 [Pseudomonadales bacterium]
MDKLIEQLNSDNILQRLGAHYTTQIQFISATDGSDAESDIEDIAESTSTVQFDINKGKVSIGDINLPLDGFSLTGSKDTWQKYCAEIPPPEFHELTALFYMGHLTLNGDMHAMQSNLFYVRRLLELWRVDQRGRDDQRQTQLKEQGK